MSAGAFADRRARLAALGVCVMLAACSGAEETPRLVGTLERDRIEIVAQAAEPIVSIAVREGEAVAAGQLLLQQDPALDAARLARADAQVAEARARLEELERGPRTETIREARARLASAEATLVRDERELARAQDLVEKRLVSQSEADRARAARDRSAAERREAGAQLDALLRGTRAEQLAQARASLEAAQAMRREIDVGAKRLEVRATRAGTIEALPFEPGERPAAGAPLAILSATSAPFARVYVPEPLRAQVRPGDRARIHVDGLAAPLEGRVRYVASQASFTPYYALTQRDRSRLVFLAEVEVVEGNGNGATSRLPAGVPVEVELLESEAGGA